MIAKHLAQDSRRAVQLCLIAEPSGAAGVAALINHSALAQGLVCTPITGGNATLGQLRAWIAQIQSPTNAASSIPSSRLRQSLHSTLLHRIVVGGLGAGKPVNESQLATQLKVSRTPLREALLQLEQEGFIRSDERRGFSIERLSAREVREIYPMIWTLEGLALRSSAVCARSPVPELARINAEFAKARNLERALDLDTQWHEQLTSQSRNRRLLETISALRFGIRRYETVYMADNRLLPESVAQHNAIIGALKEHDIDAAIKRLEENWHFGMEVLIRKMGEE